MRGEGGVGKKVNGNERGRVGRLMGSQRGRVGR